METYLELFDAGGERVALDPEQVPELSWSLTDRGGMSEVRLTLSGALADAMGLEENSRLDLYLDDDTTVHCRGYLADREPSKQAPDTTALIFHGRVARLRKLLPQRLFIFPGGRDIRDVFTALAAVAQSELAGLELEVPGSATGYTVSRLDGRVISLGDLFDQLCDAALDTLIWGVDVDSTGADRLYLRTRSASVSKALAVPSPELSATSAQRRTSEVINRLHLTGSAQSEHPNLIENASFEEPQEADEDTGNLLVNGDFEDGPPTQSGWDVPGWTQVGTASAKEKGGGTGEPDPYSGEWHIETDNFGEAFYQDVSGIIVGHRYAVICYARPESGGSAGGSVLLYWKNGGSVGAAEAPEGYGTSWLPIDCDVAAYQRFVGQWVAPGSGVDGVRIRAEVNSGGGTMLWDKFALIDLDNPAQRAWQTVANGTATLTTTWADVPAPAAHGAYGVELVASVADNDANDVVLEPSERIPVTGGLRYWFLASYQSTSGAPKTIFRVQFYKDDGSPAGAEQELIATHGSALAAWYRNGFIATAPSDATEARVRVRVRSTGTWKWDAFTFQDVRAYNGVPGVSAGAVPGVDAPYQPDGAPTVVFRAEDLITSGEDAEANASATLYGRRDGQESASELVTLAELTAFAKSYLARVAKAQVSVSITDEARQGLEMTDLVRLIGDDGPDFAADPLPMVSIQGQQDGEGQVSLSYELGAKEPQVDALIARVVRVEAHLIGKVRR